MRTLISSGLAALIRLATGVAAQEPPVALQDGPAIWFANHSSHLDFVTIWAALPREWREVVSPAAARDYWSASALRRKLASDFFQAVLIARSGRASAAENPLELMIKVLEEGRSLLIFPEGTRGVGEEVAAFKSGLYHLARRFPSAPLLPVHLENLNRILPKGTRLPVPVIARLSMRTPLYLKEDESKATFLDRARLALKG